MRSNAFLTFIMVVSMTLILVFIEAIPPTHVIHWYMIGVGLGVPILLFLVVTWINSIHKEVTGHSGSLTMNDLLPEQSSAPTYTPPPEPKRDYSIEE